MIKEYGCIGRKLVHSYSVPVHNMLADYEYVLNPMEPYELEEFMTEKKFKGINVTIPYKQDVIKYLDYIDSQADEIGAVNTVVNADGVLKGYNTDAFGMTELIKKAGIAIKDKNVLILGTGGTSKTALYVCNTLGAKSVVRVSRGKKDNVITYEEAYTLCHDTQVIINCTPVGMFPDNLGKTPVDIDLFPRLEGAVDAVYNPLRSQLVLECEKKGIKALGGLYMLVMQAVGAVKLFTGED
nr:shikimate dehydrogenase [Clostridiales bacterium]